MIKAYRRTSFRYDFIRENHEKEINFSFKFVSQEGKDKKKPHFKGLNLHFEFFNIKKGNRIHTLEFTCHFKDTNELINGEFKEKDIPSISSNLTWDEIENDMEYGSLEYVIAEIQYTFKSVNKKEELNKAELGIIKELYELYGGRMMVVASREASTYEKYSLYYMKELMKTWVMKGYSAEDVENGKR